MTVRADELTAVVAWEATGAGAHDGAPGKGAGDGPVATSLLVLAMLLIGILGYRALPVGALPAIHDLPEARKVRWSLDVDPVDLY